jgi:hypothetical protein
MALTTYDTSRIQLSTEVHMTSVHLCLLEGQEGHSNTDNPLSLPRLARRLSSHPLVPLSGKG